MFPVPEKPRRGYCAGCDVFGVDGWPCWVCGGETVTKLEPSFAGHHHMVGEVTIWGEVLPAD